MARFVPQPLGLAGAAAPKPQGAQAWGQNYNLGKVVQGGPTIGSDLNGKMLGWGSGRQQGEFTTKLTVQIVPEVADALNAKASQLSMPAVYQADENANITISPDGQVFVPGSDEQLVAVNRDHLPYGLVSVRNPFTVHQNQFKSAREGFTRVGSKVFRAALKQAAADPQSQAARRLFRQAQIYGLGQVLAQAGVDSVAKYSPEADQLVKTYYDTHMKDPDRQRTGRLGAASLFAAHPESVYFGNDQGKWATAYGKDPSILGAALAGKQRQDGGYGMSLGQAHWRKGLNVGAARKGLTAFPARTADGKAVPMQQRTNARAGECNIYGSGPLVTAGSNNQYGFRGRKTMGRAYIRNSNTAASGNRPFSCKPTPDEYVNLDNPVYQAGGRFGGNIGLQAALQKRDPEGRVEQAWRAKRAAFIEANPIQVTAGGQRVSSRWLPTGYRNAQGDLITSKQLRAENARAALSGAGGGLAVGGGQLAGSLGGQLAEVKQSQFAPVRIARGFRSPAPGGGAGPRGVAGRAAFNYSNGDPATPSWGGSQGAQYNWGGKQDYGHRRVSYGAQPYTQNNFTPSNAYPPWPQGQQRPFTTGMRGLQQYSTPHLTPSTAEPPFGSWAQKPFTVGQGY